jgi:hypothetical protein
MQGQFVTDLPEFEAMRKRPHEHVDIGEQAPPTIARGDKVRLKKGVDVAARDGQRWHLGAGTSGEVVRDIAGDGREYFIHFDEIGCTLRLLGDLIE